ncbi:uncharacterized protein I303_106683 [Kwoniella dejecticola CBS 10117]|uniref:Anti-proliferative protein domain-containing protein n=1 Tax=Kwoniella dejecticola CBS 10117 TaxID=1296121 RepID=A0A1A5ZU01_9TREE|nr:uncharacterized protein I303_08674 [Kwoniella dejecticola CBS 10117]OBR81288.1 hypothetical protein I303_08674 [Kwoniella dejecticola CBS 10117]
MSITNPPPPPNSSANLTSTSGSTSSISPAISNRSPIPSTSTPNDPQSQASQGISSLDLTLPTAISHLVQFLIQPLSLHYPHPVILSLRDELSSRLNELFKSSWEESRPQRGSGYRSLICTRHRGLPAVLVQAAKSSGVDKEVWKRALADKKSGKRGEEWESWCDPGQVTWRWGGWEWEDIGFEPFKVIKEPFQIIWQSSSSLSPSISTAIPNASTFTPARASHAIPIKAPMVMAAGPPTPGPGPTAPAVYAIPPTPSQQPRTESEGDLLPAFGTLGLGHPGTSSNANRTSSGWTSSTGSRDTSYTHSDSYSDSEEDEHVDRDTGNQSPSRSHRGTGSTSSMGSSGSLSDSNSGHTQLLTPSSRPNSADPFGSRIPALSLKEKGDHKEKEKTRKSDPRGRTPSPPNDGSTTHGNENVTPNTENTLTPSSTVNHPTPSVTPYDGGNVTVLGGGVKLGGLSRPSSVMSHRSRSRSPSISLASRALNTATTEGSGGRKQRTRRRIMPTYLGHLNSGVGGPIMGVFTQFNPNTPASANTHALTPNKGGSVGVGVSPPPVNVVGGRSVSLPTTMPRMG